MTVRAFSGTNVLDCAAGALSGNTFGTFAAIVKRSATGSWHTFLALHSSGGSALNQFAYNDANQAALWSNGDTATGPAAVATTAWGLVVVRKATGSAAPRFSVYNFTAGTWTHGNGSMALPNWTAPGASGTVRFRWETFDHFVGRVAVRAAWNTVKWAADTTGDAAIEAAGLEDTLQKWVDAAPAALWTFDQASTATAVTDLTGGGANQTALTGTTVVSGDDPPGFSFALGGGGVALTGVDNITQAQAIEAPAVTQKSTLTPAAMSQAQTTATPALAQKHTLIPAGSQQAQETTTPALAQRHTLTPSAASQAQTLATPALAQHHALAVADITQAQTIESPALGGGAGVSPVDVVQAQTIDTVVLTQRAELTIDDVVQAQGVQHVTIPGSVILELLLTGYVEPGRWRVATEPDRYASHTEPDRWRTEVEA